MSITTSTRGLTTKRDANWKKEGKSEKEANAIQMTCILAELIEQLLEDEDGSSGAEDDEGLTAKKAEDCPSQGCTQKTLHYSLRGGKSERIVAHFKQTSQ